MIDKETGLTLEYLKSILEYNPLTGDFIWKVRLSNVTKIGTVAGSFDSYGYIQIKIDKFSYKAHRLAWFYMTCEWPKAQIDHENRIRHDNIWNNLREASHAENTRNKSVSSNKINNLKGAYEREGTWYSTILVDGNGNGQEKQDQPQC